MKPIAHIFLKVILPVFLAVFCAKAQNNINNNPYNVVYNHYYYLRSQSYNELEAAKSFDINNRKKRIEIAIQLKQILDGKGIDINYDNIPKNINYIDSITQKNRFILYNKLPQIYVEKINGKWYYSKETIKEIPILHKIVYPFGSNIWAKWFPYKSEIKFFRLYPWQWIGLLIIVGVFLFSLFFLKYIFNFLFKNVVFTKFAQELSHIDTLKRIAKMFSIWVAIKTLQIFTPTLFFNTNISLPIIKGIRFLSALFLVFLVYQLAELILFYAKQYAQKSTNTWDDHAVIVLQKLLKFFIVISGIIFILNSLDVNVTTVIAGISIGGLAFALAAQDTIKNFISSIMIYFDKPFSIGDTIKTDSVEGIVMEVGFRSTRIKTALKSVVAIPNGRLADMTIENKGNLVMKKHHTELFINQQISVELLTAFMDGIKNIIYKNPMVNNNTVVVFVSNIQTTGIAISIAFTYTITTMKEEQIARENILKNILKLSEILEIKLFNQTIDTDNNTIASNFTSIEIKEKMDAFLKNLDTTNSIQNIRT